MDCVLLTEASDVDAAWRMHIERQLRSWTTGEMAWWAKAVDSPVPHSAVWPIEPAEPRRRITLDEPVAIGQILGLEGRSDQTFLDANRVQTAGRSSVPRSA